ncbi:hypothetical protein FKM82_020499 [Ascaphus truei]
MKKRVAGHTSYCAAGERKRLPAGTTAETDLRIGISAGIGGGKCVTGSGHTPLPVHPPPKGDTQLPQRPNASPSRENPSTSSGSC